MREGVDLDAASGELTVDFPEIWKQESAFLQHRYPHGMPDTQTAGTAAEFQLLTGKPLPADKVAFAVPLEVAVSDKEGQRDGLDLAVIALATADDIEKALDEKPKTRAGWAGLAGAGSWSKVAARRRPCRWRTMRGREPA